MAGPQTSFTRDDRVAPTAARMMRPAWDDVADADHFVQFYEDDAFLVDSVAGFVAAGLNRGEPALVIATDAHRAALETDLQSRGLDVPALREQGRYLALDAATMLGQFMVGDSPDPARFAEVVTAALAHLARGPAGGCRTRAFGEMVALLWADGNHAGAVRLEQLWNDLAESHTFALYCAYPMQGFGDPGHAEPFRHICDHHARVLPAESYEAKPDPDDRLRVIAELQQKARALEAEVAHRTAAQQALAARERELSDFFDTAAEGIHKVGPDGTILWANRAEIELLGYEPHEYVGRNIVEFHVDRDVIDSMLDRLLRGVPLVNQPARLRCKDGSIRHVLVHSNPLFDGDRFVCTRCFTRDVTDRVRAEEELRAAKAAAEEASRAKDQFLAVLSHELRTPLNPVLLSVASLEAEPGLPPRVRDDLAMIRRNIALETRLIDDLLDLSRVINGKMTLHRQDVDVHPLVRNVVDMVATDVQAKRLTLRLDLAAGRHRVRADSARLHQVLWNLLHNAIKFTPERGSITVRTGNADSSLVIEVVDTGVGISPQVLSRIFDPFDQGDHAHDRSLGGLGLGLAISKAVLDLHGGSLAAHSPGPNQGSSFTLTLPLLAVLPSQAPSTSSPSSDPASACTPLRILLVDDHPDTLKVLSRLLELDGHVITSATSVADAVSTEGPFDLLISDIGLPDGTGLDLLRQLRPSCPDLPAIALTGFGMEQDVRNSHDAGFSTHLTKPVEFNALKSAIRRLSS